MTTDFLLVTLPRARTKVWLGVAAESRKTIPRPASPPPSGNRALSFSQVFLCSGCIHPRRLVGGVQGLAKFLVQLDLDWHEEMLGLTKPELLLVGEMELALIRSSR